MKILEELKDMDSNQRRSIKPFYLDRSVGFRGNASFPNAERAYRWLIAKENQGMLTGRFDEAGA
jgi:hypothetical protein